MEDQIRVSKYTLNDILTDKSKAAELVTVYNSLFDDRLILSCKNCINDALFRININIKKGETMSKSEKPKCNFELKKGLVLYIPGLSLHITNDNLTDEYALMLLKRNRANLANFVRTPTDLDKINKDVNGDKKKADELDETDERPTTVEEVVKQYTKDGIIKELGDTPHDPEQIKTDLAPILLDRWAKDSKSDEE